MELLESLFPLGWQHYLIGGLVIGFAVSLLFITTGLIGGMSTVYTTVWSYVSSTPFFQRTDFVQSRNWRLVYSLGLIIGAAIWVFALGNDVPVTSVPLTHLIIGGFIAGFGARLGNGCTSGHGICGMASLNVLSVSAVIVFLTIAIITAHVVKILGGQL